MVPTRVPSARVRFGLFYEHQLPRPHADGAEEKLLRDALEQVELADRLGFHSVWEVEHHFLEEYSHSSAPEVFLAAASQRTRQIRLGHGIVQMPPAYNHPARVAERIATLDLISGGRVEFGTGESSSQSELGGFGVDRELKRAQWEEALEVSTRLLVEEPFGGHQGRFLSVPPRNLVPKPKQKPHPPLWVACSRRDTILLAARKGMGALSFSFVEPEEARGWVDDYYAIIQSEQCQPAGFAVNPNVAVVVPFMCHQDEQTAIERGIDGAHFFGYSLAHYYVFGEHRPGRTNLWEEFQRDRDKRGFARDLIRADDAPLPVRLLQETLGSLRGAIGTPRQVTELIERYEQAGVDEVIFVSQAGRNQHAHICESIELFSREVLPAFAERRSAREAEKHTRLAPAIARALARRPLPRQAPDAYTIRPNSEPWHHASANGHAPDVLHRRRDLGQRAFGWLLKDRTDAQLQRIFGTAAGQALIFRGMQRAFEAGRSDGLYGTLQYHLDGRTSTHSWLVRVADGHLLARRGVDPHPTASLRMSAATFARIAAGQQTAAAAAMTGKLQLDGDLKLVARLGEVLQPPT
jgi:alkanesulfonate monooxygenase SsuD/methylene tetrahydromethanopterin reductase-like flavin-dependent oxidoreductase (luciferase family)/putative sterol carrier protein